MIQLGIVVVDGSGDRRYNGSEVPGGQGPADLERGEEGIGMEKVVTVEIPDLQRSTGLRASLGTHG